MTARVLAEIFERVESETPFGGRATSFQPAGVTWIAPGPRRRRERTDAASAGVVETSTAEARMHPGVATGRVLRFRGADWVVAAVEEVRPGRMALTLERDR